MKVVKFLEFIKEELMFDTPETYISTLLSKLKIQIDKMFDFEKVKPNTGEKSISQAKKDSKEKDKMSFKDLGLSLESSEISKYSKLYDSLTVTFRDDNFMYTMIIMIDIKEGIPKDKEKNFGIDDIENCYIKFKKYDLDNIELIGEISKNVKVKDIDEEFIIDLKIELDDTFGDEEEFEIETI
jgi:hypothetical protein